VPEDAHEAMHTLLDYFLQDNDAQKEVRIPMPDGAEKATPAPLEKSVTAELDELEDQCEQFLIDLTTCYLLFGCPVNEYHRM
jgi:hypothetical protein